MIPLLLIGGGGHCRSSIDVIESTHVYDIVGVVEREGGPAEPVLGYSIAGHDGEVEELVARWRAVLITVGQIESPAVRVRLYETAMSAGALFPVIISPKAYVSKHAEILDGTIVMHSATVNAGSSIGSNCIINSHSLIEHDVAIGSHSHISTGARVNGNVTIGRETFIGSGAIINQGVSIGAGCVIASGSIIRHDVAPGTQVKGENRCPATH